MVKNPPQYVLSSQLRAVLRCVAAIRVEGAGCNCATSSVLSVQEHIRLDINVSSESVVPGCYCKANTRQYPVRTVAGKERTVELATHFYGSFTLQDLFKACALLRKHVGDLAKQVCA